ncbi:hypothetical protein D9M73_273190 [compost metagenome]
MPGIALNCTSSGVATEDAIVSGLAPGSRALTCMVGNSASGNGATGSLGKAMAPSKTRAKVNRTVAIGWSTHQAEIEPWPFMAEPGCRRPARAPWCRRRPGPGCRA